MVNVFLITGQHSLESTSVLDLEQTSHSEPRMESSLLNTRQLPTWIFHTLMVINGSISKTFCPAFLTMTGNEENILSSYSNYDKDEEFTHAC